MILYKKRWHFVFLEKMTDILSKNIRKLKKRLENESISSASIVFTTAGETKESCVNLTKKSVLQAPKNFLQKFCCDEFSRLEIYVIYR